MNAMSEKEVLNIFREAVVTNTQMCPGLDVDNLLQVLFTGIVGIL